jgi:hypothetical protein
MINTKRRSIFIKVRCLIYIIFKIFYISFFFISDSKTKNETKIGNFKLRIKNDIDIHIENLKSQLEQARDYLFETVDQICERELK